MKQKKNIKQFIQLHTKKRAKYVTQKVQPNITIIV